MQPGDARAWMLSEAMDWLDSAQRLQRQFFRIGQSLEGPVWEPPVDMVDDGRRMELLVALPGVPQGCFDVRIESQAIVVRGDRVIGSRIAPGTVVRLEIPYGRFERRIELPAGVYEVVAMRLEDGCLRIQLELAP
jgi:HSP20 family protein